MKKILLAVTAALLTASSSAALEQPNAIHATPPLVPHPMPQGLPYVFVGATVDSIVELRYGVVNGRRVLVNAHTLEVIYILRP